MSDTAVILYTSGTTGVPKGVPLSHTNLLSNAKAVIGRLGQQIRDVVVGVLPSHHAFGLMGSVIAPLLLGAEVTFTRFTPQRVAAAIAQRHATVFLGVPSMYRLLVRVRGNEEAFRSLRLRSAGATPCRQTFETLTGSASVVNCWNFTDFPRHPRAFA